MTETAKPSAPDTTSSRAVDPKRLMRLATYAAVAAGCFLVAIKLVAWWLTGSVALLGSLIDSGLDIVASTINLIAVRHSLIPRDHEHRFGHGKAEALAGLGQSTIVFLSALYLLYQCYVRFSGPVAIQQSTIGIVVIGISIAVTLALVRFQRVVISKTGSLAISADELHYKSDLLMNAAVIGALALSGLAEMPLVDPIVGIGIAIYILTASWHIMIQSFDQLMDKELPNETRFQIKDTVLRHPEVLDIHDLRTRSAGTSDFIQLHLELDPNMTLVEAHKISDEVEAELKRQFPRAEIIIHQDPAGYEDVPALDKR